MIAWHHKSDVLCIDRRILLLSQYNIACYDTSNRHIACLVKIEPAPDEWDRGYNVDYFIKINDDYIGFQIKPAGFEYITQIINEREQQKKTHEKFTAKYGGKVFYIISITGGKNKIIHNPEVIEEIKKEIKKLT